MVVFDILASHYRMSSWHISAIQSHLTKLGELKSQIEFLELDGQVHEQSLECTDKENSSTEDQQRNGILEKQADKLARSVDLSSLVEEETTLSKISQTNQPEQENVENNHVSVSKAYPDGVEAAARMADTANSSITNKQRHDTESQQENSSPQDNKKTATQIIEAANGMNADSRSRNLAGTDPLDTAYRDQNLRLVIFFIRAFPSSRDAIARYPCHPLVEWQSAYDDLDRKQILGSHGMSDQKCTLSNWADMLKTLWQFP